MRGTYNILNLIKAAGLALTMGAFAAPALAAPGKAYPSRGLASAGKGEAFDTACTNLESWQVGRLVPKFYADKFIHAFDGKAKEPPFQLLLLADLLKNSSTQPEVKFLAEYWVYRLMYDMKLVHIAHRGFASLASREHQPGTEAAQMAALSCLNRIHGQYPSLIQETAPIDKLALFPKAPQSLEAVTDLAKAKLSAGGDQANIDAELAYLQGAPAHEGLVRILQGAQKGGEPDMLRYTIQLFKSYPYPEGFSTDPDAIYLYLGEAFYGMHKYERANRSFTRVRNTSNHFIHALLGQAWSQLLQEKYAEAVGVSQNMIHGSLRDVFAPEANLVVSIALNETCNYPEAVESIKFFKRNYARTNAWLQKWKATSGGNANIYKGLASYLKKKAKYPDRVVTEWMRSPVFTAGQDEMNLLLDERRLTGDLSRRISKAFAGKRDAKWIAVYQDLHNQLGAGPAAYNQREFTLINGINHDLNLRTDAMIASMSDVTSNMALVEAEIYNNISDKMVSDYNRPDPKARGPANAKLDGGAHQGVIPSGKVWDWGKFDVEKDGEESQAESWDDEVGFIRADIQNRCPSK